MKSAHKSIGNQVKKLNTSVYGGAVKLKGVRKEVKGRSDF